MMDWRTFNKLAGLAAMGVLTENVELSAEQAAFYRCIISYKPSSFGGRLNDFPLTLAYGKRIDALRRKYRAWIWDAEFCNTLGASVTAEGAHRYTVFQTAAGKRAVIVVNLETRKAITATLDVPNPGSLMAATPEQPDARPVSGTLQIPARSAVVVMEQ